MRKQDVLTIIDEVMNNREIDSIRNAILAIRDKVKELPGELEEGTIKLPLRSRNPLMETSPYYDGAEYVCIDVLAKVDTGVYGEIWYE